MTFDLVSGGVAALVGLQFDRVTVNADALGDGSLGDEILFYYGNDVAYKLMHFQDCCETVTVESITGDLDDIAGTPILEAYQETGDLPPLIEDGYEPESSTWTFFRIITIKGTVVIRFYGTSNGYYGEEADLCEANPPIPIPDRAPPLALPGVPRMITLD